MLNNEITVSGTFNIVADAQGRISQTNEVRIGCDTSNAPVIINLPSIASMKIYKSVKLIIFDISENASNNNITVNAAGSDNIGSDGDEIISSNGGGFSLEVSDETNWLSTSSSEQNAGGASEWMVQGGELTFPDPLDPRPEQVYTVSKIYAEAFEIDYSTLAGTGSSVFPNLKDVISDEMEMDLAYSTKTVNEMFPVFQSFVSDEILFGNVKDTNIIFNIRHLIGTIIFEEGDNALSISLPNFQSSQMEGGNVSGVGIEDYTLLQTVETPKLTTVENLDPTIPSAFVVEGSFPALTSLVWFEYILNNVVASTGNTFIFTSGDFTGNAVIDNTEIQRFLDSVATSVSAAGTTKGFAFFQLSGATSLTYSGTSLATIQMGGCTNLASMDISSITTVELVAGGQINYSGCSILSSFTVNSSLSCNNVAVDGCALPQADIDALFASLDASGVTGGTCDAGGGTNATPSAAGLVSKANLVGKGWAVTNN